MGYFTIKQKRNLRPAYKKTTHSISSQVIRSKLCWHKCLTHTHTLSFKHKRHNVTRLNLCRTQWFVLTTTPPSHLSKFPRRVPWWISRCDQNNAVTSCSQGTCSTWKKITYLAKASHFSWTGTGNWFALFDSADHFAKIRYVNISIYIYVGWWRWKWNRVWNGSIAMIALALKTRQL